MSTDASPPTRGPVRWSRIAAGIAVILFLALPCLVGAVVAAVGRNAILRNNPEVEGRAPGTLSFDSGSERYVIALSASPTGSSTGSPAASDG
jgi:hypothetical protein